MDEEARLIGLAKAGDREAFDALAGPLIDVAYRLAFAMLHDREAAEDAVQEAALRAWMRLENLRPGWGIRPWFLGIVANQCRSTRRGRWWSVLKLWAPDSAIASPEDVVVRGADIRRALRVLPAERLEALVLRYYLDLSLEEVVSITGVAVGTVKSRIYRGLEQIRPRVSIPEEVLS